MRQSEPAIEPVIEAFFDQETFTISYLVFDPATLKGLVIDPVFDFDQASGKAHHDSAELILTAAARHGVTIERVLETHAHADHLSAAPYLKARTGARIGIGADITKVQAVFGKVFNLDDIAPEGRDFDDLFADGDTFLMGGIKVEVMHTPGHTPACATYLIGQNGFVGDTLFMPDFGTARCDFPGGDAATLYLSVRRILSLPPETRLFMCHDYKAPGRDVYAWQTSVAEQRARNIHIRDGISEADFVAMRTARDATLAVPRLLLPSIQVNIRAGKLPRPEANGTMYLKAPISLSD
jgi:glyoxylase-like metal-dependent hydrolase (beta-lactamase superfamily II)